MFYPIPWYNLWFVRCCPFRGHPSFRGLNTRTKLKGENAQFITIFISAHRSENIRFVCGGARSVGCEIGSRSISSLHDIWNLWTIWAENKKYSICASRFPTQFRSPIEKGQTFEFCLKHFGICVFGWHSNLLQRNQLFNNHASALLYPYHSAWRCFRNDSWNWPSTRNLSGLNVSGSEKSIGLYMTDSNDAFQRGHQCV